jgi:hypothetical protein
MLSSRGADESEHFRSAELHSAVSQIFNLRRVYSSRRFKSLPFYKAITNPRYDDLVLCPI